MGTPPYSACRLIGFHVVILPYIFADLQYSLIYTLTTPCFASCMPPIRGFAFDDNGIWQGISFLNFRLIFYLIKSPPTEAYPYGGVD